jgi:superfamily II DNA helicase RecQ
MCLDHQKFSALLLLANFMKNMATIIVDEGHCVSQWGEHFRKQFSELGKLQSWLLKYMVFSGWSFQLHWECEYMAIQAIIRTI